MKRRRQVKSWGWVEHRLSGRWAGKNRQEGGKQSPLRSWVHEVPKWADWEYSPEVEAFVVNACQGETQDRSSVHTKGAKVFSLQRVNMKEPVLLTALNLSWIPRYFRDPGTYHINLLFPQSLKEKNTQRPASNLHSRTSNCSVHSM